MIEAIKQSGFASVQVIDAMWLLPFKILRVENRYRTYSVEAWERIKMRMGNYTQALILTTQGEMLPRIMNIIYNSGIKEFSLNVIVPGRREDYIVAVLLF